LVRNANPFAAMQNAIQLGLMITEAQSVVAMRIMGMAGIWSVTPAENARMISEKLSVVTRASTDATRAMIRGQGPEAVTAAAIKPLRQKTRANAKRLAKRGLKRS
jgi:hypothetical protein